MKLFKRLVVLLLTVAILSFFTSCIWIPRKTNYDINEDALSSVEIYCLDNNSSHYDDFVETEQPIYTLKEDQIDGFIDELENIRFDDSIFIVLAAMDPSFYYGEWVVRINYDDGSYDLISCDGYGATYDENGLIVSTNHYSYDDEKWEEFVKSYLPAEDYSE